ncbi:hypothetical protein AVEN_265206-1 [Araneus ventricosus]|uniref:Uncharacterized protein n=1 Tax=Araneus ventricosus TaxID=182803 RepID=A0A4Y2CP09_ARAVE|nr:hypothetical protein AVEN_265206-1 [Araneus ventricosus]
MGSLSLSLVIKTPAQSPDLNPIEHLWDNILHEIEDILGIGLSSGGSHWLFLTLFIGDILAQNAHEFCRKFNFFIALQGMQGSIDLDGSALHSKSSLFRTGRLTARLLVVESASPGLANELIDVMKWSEQIQHALQLFMKMMSKRISAKKFCSDYPDLLEQLKYLEELCMKHPIFCKGNFSMLVIPKHGYFTNYSKEGGSMALEISLNDSLDDVRPIGGDSIYAALSYAECYFNNLHLYESGSKLAFLEFDLTKIHSDHVSMSRLSLLGFESVCPLSERQVESILHFGIHSPYVPIDPYFEGFAIRLGFDYKVDIQLEKEEHLLPPPYQTNCRDYETSENPSPYEEKEEHLLPPPYQTNCRDNGFSEGSSSITNRSSYQEKEEHLLPPLYQTNCRDNGPSEDSNNIKNPNSYQVSNFCVWER